MLLSLLERRRSVRRYLDRPVEPEIVDRIIEAALRSPSSRGFNPWQFVAVDDRRLLADLATAKPHGASFLKGAPLGIVVCADPDISDVWIEDASIASVLIHLAAASIGLGSCWIQIRERPHDTRQSAEAYIRDRLNIPDHLAVLSVIAIGYPAEEKPGHPKAGLQYGNVHWNRYGETRGSS